MTSVIVGIHGLANKPERQVLADWWERSIREGLAKNSGVRGADFEFHMVYWADLLYKYPAASGHWARVRLHVQQPALPRSRAGGTEEVQGELDG